jgi:amino acid transporter
MAEASGHPPEAQTSGLRKNTLPFVETLAQSVANIAPTATPSLTIPLVFASAGNGTWLAFLLATVGLVLVSCCINQFARRSATPGSLYHYVSTGLGERTGLITGWALFLAYVTTGVVTVYGFAIFSGDLLLTITGVTLPVWLWYLLCVGPVWFCAYKDIQLSARLMLTIEAASVGAILILGIIVWAARGFVLDAAQITLEGVALEHVRLGMVLAVLAFVGFESATALGVEAQNPLQNIPRSVLWSTVMVGMLFVIMSYIEVVGFAMSPSPLEKSTTPLPDLATLYHVPAFGPFLALAAALTFFSCCLACVNAVARILFTMGRDGQLPASIGQAHATNETPHIAVTMTAVVIFILTAGTTLAGIGLIEGVTYYGSIATYGFLLVYILISLVASVYLRREGSLNATQVVVTILAICFMMLPVVGSLYPVPPYPINLLPYIFLVYMAMGVIWAFTSRHKMTQATAAQP